MRYEKIIKVLYGYTLYKNLVQHLNAVDAMHWHQFKKWNKKNKGCLDINELLDFIKEREEAKSEREKGNG